MRKLDAGEPERQSFIALLSRVDLPPTPDELRQWGEHIPTPAKRRADILFDALRLQSAQEEDFLPENPRNRPLVRLMTTETKFEQMAGRPPASGEWYQLELATQPTGPRIWTAVEDQTSKTGFQASDRYWLRSINFLGDSESGLAGFSTGGETSAFTLAMFRAYQTKSNQAGATALLKTLAHRLQSPGPLKVRAIDVGQAAFICVHDDVHSHLFFDVGQPLWFNHKSMPKEITFPPPTSNAFVVLSHWDYDHYSRAYSVPALRNLTWLAPEDGLGPNARKFATTLGPRLVHLKHGVDIPLGCLKLTWGQATDVKDKNNRGIVGIWDNSNRKILLTGDAAYSFIPSWAKLNLSGASIPHHAANSSHTPVPKPIPPARAVISTGLPNRYQHPSSTVIAAHQGSWHVEITGRSSSGQRGNKDI